MTRTRKRVLTVGGALIDTIALIDSDHIERMSMNNADAAYLLLQEGRKTEAELISTHPGGGAVNSAVAFSRLGFEVASLVKIGRDSRGEAIETAFAHEKVSRKFIVHTEQAATGASVLISSHDRNAAIFTFRGANSCLVESDIAPASFATDIVYVTGLSNQSADVFPFIVDSASLRGAFISANPGIRQLTARGEDFQKTLPKLGLLSMNKQEASAFVPRLAAMQQHAPKRANPVDAPDLMRRGFSASGFDMGFGHFIEALLSLGVPCILVTDGRQGAYAADSSEIVYCPALPVEVVGTAGAGDAFTATFTAFFANGASLGDAMHYAATNASSVVQFADTQSGLLSRDALEVENAVKTPLMKMEIALKANLAGACQSHIGKKTCDRQDVYPSAARNRLPAQ
jgi:ribokinase